MGATALELQQSGNRAEADTQTLSDAFAKEFGNKAIDEATAKGSQSAVGKIVDSHFGELANLALRRDGSPLTFSTPARTVSYADLKEMEKLADPRLGLENYYAPDRFGAMRSEDVGWAKLYGVGTGALAGGILRLAVPILRGQGTAVTLGVMALTGLAGYKAGEYLGHLSFENRANSNNYLTNEKADYGELLGNAWKRNTQIAGTAGFISGALALGFGAPRVAVGLGVAGIMTYLGSPLAYQLGYHSATSELQRESELGRRIEQEWKAR